MEVYISAILRKLSDIFHLNPKSSPESGECNLVLHADNKAPGRVVVLVNPFVSFSVATVFFFITYAFFLIQYTVYPCRIKTEPSLDPRQCLGVATLWFLLNDTITYQRAIIQLVHIDIYIYGCFQK